MVDSEIERMRLGRGFIAALDQSASSTPRALTAYGVAPSAYSTPDEMLALAHGMRSRIMTSSAFTHERILAVILFEGTMDRDIAGRGAAEHLREAKGISSFLKVDRGLADEINGTRLMAPIPDLADLLARATAHGVLGTKARSLIRLADPAGIAGVVAQQMEVARAVLDAGLVPIVEPEVDIHSPDKAHAEDLLHDALADALSRLTTDERVILKLTLPEVDDLYSDLVAHPRVLRVAALSGGFTRDEATARLTRQPGMIASFSRALTEGLRADQSQAEFDETLDQSIAAIYQASLT